VIFGDRLQVKMKSEEYGLKSCMDGPNMKKKITGKTPHSSYRAIPQTAQIPYIIA